ncbi:MAG TPA: KH domain-containing protein [Candidatus Baltobacteraceae bacterium]|nr:KH domain-containing protein [Candidatus Baltobacteraceae bacterium]
MSAFDDEFGLFNEEGEEAERRSTLGARKIASSETIIDDIEPEDDAPRRRGGQGGGGVRGGGRRKGNGGGGRFDRREKHRDPVDPVASRERAAQLLEFLAKKLVEKPDEVIVDNFPPEGGEPASIELIVDPDDIGKVIGRSGRVAQALRTIIRATAEGKIGVEIFDTTELEDGEEDGE